MRASMALNRDNEGHSGTAGHLSEKDRATDWVFGGKLREGEGYH
jgi:hypothetical protein